MNGRSRDLAQQPCAVGARGRPGRVALSHGKAQNVIQTIRAEPARAREDRAVRISSTNREAGAGAAGAAPGSASDRILARLTERAGAEGFGRSIAQQARVILDGSRLSITVPTGYIAQLLDARYKTSLVEAAREELVRAGRPAADVELTISVDGRAFGADSGASTLGLARAGARRTHEPRTLGKPRAEDTASLRYRLEDFVVGESNRLAFSAAEKLADPATPRTFSPLFIHGTCGLGKTHLLQGIAQRYREKRPRANWRYMTAEAFTNEYVTALRNNRLEAFRKAYRSVELLCLDDVQFLSNKTATQAELLHTFDAIDLSGAKVALASDEHPRQVRKFSEALVSRFMSGMVVRLESPEPALRERIVQKLAERRGMKLEPAAARLIADQFPGQGGSVRDLEGVLVRLDALTRLLPELSAAGGGEVGLLLVRKALGLQEEASRGSGVRRPVRIDQIVDEVCRALHIQVGDFVGRGRHKRVVLARAMTAYLARSLTTLSYPEIAKGMGRPNHSTVVTACQRITKQIEQNEALPEGDWNGLGLNGLTIGGLCEQVRRDIQRPPTA
jgi:chromosomal replication initiator protein